MISAIRPPAGAASRSLFAAGARRSASSRPSSSVNNVASKPAPRRPTASKQDALYRPPEPAGGSKRLQQMNNKSVWASWKDLSYRTKLVFAAGIATFASAGLLAADRLEEIYPARNNRALDRRSQVTSAARSGDPKMMDVLPEAQREHLGPRLFSVSVVDRQSSTAAATSS